MKTFLLILLLAIYTNAKIEWKFYTGYYNIELAPVRIGTPDQRIHIWLKIYNESSPGIWIPSADLDDTFGFNMSASSTFKQLEDDRTSVLGRDNMVIEAKSGVKQRLQQIQFNVVKMGSWPLNTVSLAHATPLANNTFLDSIFAHENESIAVIVYDYIKYVTDFAGVLTLGERPTKCEQKWTMLDEVNPVDLEKYPQWNMKLDKISVGKFAVLEPGIFAIDFKYTRIGLSPELYPAILNVLNVNENGWLPCDASQSFVFTLSGLEFVFGPDDYIDRTYKDFDMCSFTGYVSHQPNFFALPFTVLRDRCFLLDYEKKQVGFADKRK